MTQVIAERLEALAEQDAVLAPLARLYATALRLANRSESVVLVTLLREKVGSAEGGVPFLHRQTLAVDVGQLGQFLYEVGILLERESVSESQSVAQLAASGQIPVLELVRSGLMADSKQIEELASGLALPTDLCTVLAQIVVVPVLAQCLREMTGDLTQQWRAGYCPLCGAWPVLAEFRGLARERWLRCGRCGSGWRYPHQECPFCGTSDHRRLRYLAEEGKRDSQRIEVCLDCRGYVKTFATLGAWSHGEVLLQDLLTVELDFVATEQGYQRPAGLGFPLELTVVSQELLA